MNTMKQVIAKTLIALLLFAGTFVAPMATVGAQTRDDVCRGVAAAGGSCTEQGASTTVDDIVGLAVNILSTIVGIVAVIMIIIGGFKYITSSGDSSNVQSAKNTILYAIVGLVVVALAQIITGFVLDRATN
jgi:type IV secretion system pilin